MSFSELSGSDEVFVEGEDALIELLGWDCGNVLNDKELLPDQSTLELGQLDKGGRDWIVRAESRQSTAKYPDCGVLSTVRHSSYLRHLKDLPIQGRPVQLKVRVGRWCCRNTGCKPRIFCQQLSNEVAQTHARETNCFRDAVRRFGYALGGRPGERLSQCLGLPVNKDKCCIASSRWRSHVPSQAAFCGLPL